jgi:hypothetical protein
VIEAGGALKLFFAGGRLSKLDSDVFNFDEHVDVLVIAGAVYVYQRRLFEEMFAYVEKVYRPAADLALEHLRGAAILSDLEAFAAACRQDVNKLRKLADIGWNIAPRKLTWAAVQQIQGGWNVNVQLDPDNQRIVVSPATTWSILKLLDDDYLRSDMTGSFYEVQSKRRVKRRVGRPRPRPTPSPAGAGRPRARPRPRRLSAGR